MSSVRSVVRVLTACLAALTLLGAGLVVLGGLVLALRWVWALALA